MSATPKKQGTAFCTLSKLSKSASCLGRYLTDDEFYEALRSDDANDSKMSRGALERIALSIENIERLLLLAMQPQLEIAAARTQELRANHRRVLEQYMRNLEKKHGPMPVMLRKALFEQMYRTWHHSRFNNYASVFYGVTDSIAVEPEFGLDIMQHRPPCGRHTKTRKLYDAWIKKKARKTPGKNDKPKADC